MPELISGPTAAATMLAFQTWRSGYCLEAVWQAYKRVGASTGRSAPTALSAFYQSGPARHDTPPDGVPVWWGAREGSAAGDVVISVGGGRVVATDWPTRGVIGICTIEQRTAQIGRPYLGWTEAIFDQQIDYPGREPEDMPITKDEIRDIAAAVQTDTFVNRVAAAVWSRFIGPEGGSGNADRGRAGDILAGTSSRAYKAAVRSGQALAILAAAEGDPDVAAIVAALKEALPAAVVDELKARL